MTALAQLLGGYEDNPSRRHSYMAINSKSERAFICRPYEKVDKEECIKATDKNAKL